MKNPFLLTFSEKSLFITIQRKILFYYYSEKNPLLLLFREKSFRRTSFQRKVFREKSSAKNPSEKPPITTKRSWVQIVPGAVFFSSLFLHLPAVPMSISRSLKEALNCAGWVKPSFKSTELAKGTKRS